MKYRMLGLLVASAVTLTGVSALARLWTSRSGDRLDAEFDSVQGGQVVLKGTNDRTYRVSLDQLSGEDREFVATQQKGSGGSTGTKPKQPVDSKPFMDVMNRACVRCHKVVCGSVDEMVKRRWLVPGKPDGSIVYTIIGKHRKQGATYHNLSDQDKKTVRDFVLAYQTNAVPARAE
jgi:hypothetical protein